MYASCFSICRKSFGLKNRSELRRLRNNLKASTKLQEFDSEREPRMNQGDQNDTPFHFEDPQEEEIYRSLREKIGPGPAAFFKDVCRLKSARDPLETRSHLIHHCLRELEGALREALAPATAEQVEGEEPKSDHERNVRLILRGLDIPEDSDVAQAWLDIPGGDNPLARGAHRRRLTVRRMDEEFENLWRNFKRILSVVLDRFEAHYLPVFDVLDELLEKDRPNSADLTILLGRVPNNAVTLNYFFTNLEHSGWLEPLRQEGVFNDVPPPVEAGDEEGGIRFPPWPQGRYLARMATEDPETVRDIIREVPRTENPAVYHELGDVLLELPQEIQSSLVDEAVRWLGQEHVSAVLPNKLAKAVVELAEGGYAGESLLLAQAVFEVQPQTNDNQSFIRSSIETHFYSPWQFRNEIEAVADALIDVAPQEGFCFLGDVLEVAVGAFVEARPIEPPEDHSSIWRSAIDGQGQGVGGREVKQTLVNVVRDAAEAVACTDEDQLRWVIGELEDRPYRIFHRISLHLLRSRCSVAVEPIEARITDRDLFEDSTVAREYFLLLQECWPSLSEEVQGAYLTFVEAGPEGGEDTEYRDRWGYSRLLPIRGHLTGEWRDRFEDLNERFGPAEEHDLPGARRFEGGFAERPSPISADELRAMSVEEVVEYAERWEPSEGFMAPTPAELAQTIAGVVQDAPTQFASRAELFRELQPVYLRGLSHGLKEAVKAEDRFNWTPVLNLGKWIVAQDRELDGDEGGSPGELPGWKETRKSMVRLLREGLKDRESSLPCNLRDDVWEVLEPLTSDPDPMPETEAEYVTPESSPFTLSINTVRGEAIHAIFDYLDWVRRCSETDGETIEERGIDELAPEAQAVLERHLDSTEDDSLAVRSVYGQRFPFMILIDADWAEDMLHNIFPLDAESADLWKAAWAGYINWNHPHTNVVPLLLDHYSKAVRLIGEIEAERVKEALAKHLMSIYWWSEPELPLEDQEGLIPQFFSVADDSLRAEAIQYVGRSLSATEEEIGEGILERLRALWDWRLEAIRGSEDTREFAEELKAYGFWLTSEKLDWGWCLERFVETLRLCPQTGFNLYYPITTLAELSEDLPLKVIRAVELILMRDTEGWGITARREELRELFRTVLNSDDPDAEAIATQLINRLAAQGYLDFRNLLS